MSTVRPAEQHVWVQTGGGTKSGLLKKFEIIKSMVIKFEKKIILLKSDERLWKSERMKFLKRKNKIERKLRRVIKLVNEWEVQASTERKTSVIIKDCGLVIIGKYCVISLFGLCYLNELFMDHYYQYYHCYCYCCC